MNSHEDSGQGSIGERIRRLRLALGMSQLELANGSGVASGLISILENGRDEVDPKALQSIAETLDCDVRYLLRRSDSLAAERPKLRAYADASQRAVDQTTNDTVTAVDAILETGLRRLGDRAPGFYGDLNDDFEIDAIALETREAAGLGSHEVIPNVIRAAERLGVVVLPMDSELGRHWGYSTRVSDVSVIRVTRPSNSPDNDIPGDRQRFTVAHELGHLVLHAGVGQPGSPEHAARLEEQANRFAAEFLVPGDAALNDLRESGDRVTLGALASLKVKWGYSIKAFVYRYRQLGVIDDDQARSLYKQISARRWNKDEPHRVGTESAAWLARALLEKFPFNATHDAATTVGLGDRYFKRWLDWSPSGAPARDAEILSFPNAVRSERAPQTGRGRVTRLRRRPG